MSIREGTPLIPAAGGPMRSIMPSNLPALSRTAFRLLQELTETVAVSGAEGPARRVVRRALRRYAARITTDTLGNLLVHRPASSDIRRPLRVLLAAHLDEVGFLLTHRAGRGLFRFRPVGGLRPETALGQAVWVGSHRRFGVVGGAPTHLLPDAPRLPAWEDLRIDVGPHSPEVEPGQYATFATPFRRVGDTIFAKALDDRVGVVTLIELVRRAPPHLDLWAAFTVQEEVGLRGARVIAHAVQPHVALALDCTPARDIPDAQGRLSTRHNTRLGHGPALYLADRMTVSDPRLVRHFQRTAEQIHVPYQFRQAGGGATDAGAMHVQRAGIPSLSVSVPARGLHTPVATLRRTDWQAAFQLVWAALRALTPALLE